MPSPLYNDANLYKRPRPEDDLAYGQAPPGRGPNVPDAKDALMAAAYASLERADAFQRKNPTSALANLETRLASLSQGREDVKQPGRDIATLGYLNPALAPLLLPGIMDPAEDESAGGNAAAAAASLLLGTGLGRQALKTTGKAVWQGGKTSLSGLKNLVSKMGASEAPLAREGALTFDALSPAAQGRNINATNLLDERFSPKVAGKLEGIPGAGQSKLAGNSEDAWLQMGDRTQIPEQSVDDVLAGLSRPGKQPSTAGLAEGSMLGDRTVPGSINPLIELLPEGGLNSLTPQANERIRQLRAALLHDTLGETDPMFTPRGGEALFNVARRK